MITSSFSFTSLFLLVSLLTTTLVDARPCTDQTKILSCATLENRVCQRVATDNSTDEFVEECGQCLQGYIPSLTNSSNCIAIHALNLGIYIAQFDPFWQDDLNTTHRLELLRATAERVSAHNAVVDPTVPDYYLQIGPYAAHTEPETQGLRGVAARTIESDRRANALIKYADFVEQRNQLTDGNSNNDDEIPNAIDWVSRGAVTSVKDQGQCGCCWTISTVGAVEGIAAIDSVDMSFLVDLSWQELISCCDTDHQYGCDGGYVTDATQWASDNGLTSDAQYPFTDADGKTTTTCLMDQTNKTVSVNVPLAVTAFDSPDTVEERIQNMKQALSKQPVSILMNADCSKVYDYGSGVLTSDTGCQCTSSSRSCLDHAILMVGYNDNPGNGEPAYWKIKNSWGRKWGEDGYFRVAQTGGGDWGLFGVLAQGTAPLSASNLTDATSGGSLASPSWITGTLLLIIGTVLSITRSIL